MVELDGGGHYVQNQMAADAERTRALQRQNLTVIRICNLDIDTNFRGVCEYIDMAVQKSLPQSASLTAPSSEGALEQNMKEKKIIALGFFDGVHLGHQALLKECAALAQQLNMDPAAITFHRHPQTLFADTVPLLLNGLEDRSRLLRQYGMTQIITVPVSPVVMQMPWQDFLARLTEEGAAGFVCGKDFRFGHRGEGNAQLLESYCRERNLPCVIVADQVLQGQRISSTYIRQLMEAGEMERAVQFLGHPHILSGQVVKGQQLGREIGIPTANLLIPQGVLVPKFGVYACRIITDQGEFSAVTNVGTRPTVSGNGVTVEPWILDFEGDLYGKIVTLEFYRFLRPEKKFASLSELRSEIRENATQVRKFFEKT